MKKNISIIVFMFAFFQIANAQQDKKENGLEQIATRNTGSNWYVFNKGISLSERNINSPEIKKYFELDADNSFVLIKSDTDDLKITHQHFQQKYKGIALQHTTFKLHQTPGKPLEASGKFVAGFTKEMPQTISFQQALDFAKTYYPASVYMWEDSTEEALLLNRKKSKWRTYYPDEELIWAQINQEPKNQRSENYTLAYKIRLAAKQPWFVKEVYIDASNGKLLKTSELEFKCGNETIPTNFNGLKNIQFQNPVPTNYLVDECGSGGKIFVSNNGNISNPYSKNHAVPWDTTSNNIRSACSSLWGVREATKYFYTVHGHDGWDDDAADIDLRQNAVFYVDVSPPLTDTPYYDNASFNNFGVLKVGNCESAGPNGMNTWVKDDYNTIDVLAHEFTHGITFETCDLIYQGEPGALNESFSDIFGAIVYQYTGLYGADSNIWLHGHGRVDTANAPMHTRNLKNPSQFGHPSTYLTDPLWHSTAVGAPDEGGVHTNSGVQNYMFYLLVMGGSGTNANGQLYTISGVGFTIGRTIAYKALTAGYLDDNSNFNEARNAWVHAAVDLYGPCSAIANTVGKCWAAVGVLNYGLVVAMCGNYSGPQFLYSVAPYQTAGFLGCTTNIIGTAQVNVNGLYVEFPPGFTTNVGAFFTAQTNDCYYSTY